jgi:hypothetical protein
MSTPPSEQIVWMAQGPPRRLTGLHERCFTFRLLTRDVIFVGGRAAPHWAACINAAAARSSNTVRWRCGIECEIVFGQIGNGDRQRPWCSLAFANVPQRLPQKLPKAPQMKSAWELNDWNCWRSLGDSNPFAVRGRAAGMLHRPAQFFPHVEQRVGP